MLRDLALSCESCDAPLDSPVIVLRTAAGERRAYECACGAITVTVARAGHE
jgi:hypothetical protein